MTLFKHRRINGKHHFLLAILVTLSACGGGGGGSSDDQSGPPSTPQVQPPVSPTNTSPVFTSGNKIETLDSKVAIGYFAEADDADLDNLSYSITGGLDQNLFSINADTGELRFVSKPSAKMPADIDGDNLYELTIGVSDDRGGADQLALTVAVHQIDLSRVESIATTDDHILMVDRYINALVSVHKTTGELSIVSDNANSGPSLFGLQSLQVDNSSNQAYLLNYSSKMTNGIAYSVIAVDLDTGTRTLISSVDKGDGPPLSTPRDMLLQTDNNRLLIVDERANALISVDLASGDRTIISSATLGTGIALKNPISISSDITSNRVLVLNRSPNEVLAIDLTTGNRARVDIGSGPSLFNTEKIRLDAANNRLLTHNIFGDLVALDLISGNRSVVYARDEGSNRQYLPSRLAVEGDTVYIWGSTLENLSRLNLNDNTLSVVLDNPSRRGTGPNFRFMRGIALDRDNNRALIVDMNLNALFAVDLTSGDRTIISSNDIGGGAFWGGPTALTITNDASYAFVLDSINERLLKIDLATGQRQIISDNNSGPPISADAEAIVLDEANDRIFIANSTNIIMVDLLFGNHRLVSQEGGRGTGSALQSLSYIALDTDGDLIVIADRDVVRVNISSGNRTDLPDISITKAAAIDIDTNQLYFASSSYHDIHVKDLNNLIFTEKVVTSDLYRLLPTPAAAVFDNDVLWVIDTTLNALVSIDLVTGIRAIVSK